MVREKKQKLQDAIRQLRERYYDAVALEVQNSDRPYSEIGKTFGISEQTVYTICRLRGLCRTAQQPDAQQSNLGEISPEGGDNGEL